MLTSFTAIGDVQTLGGVHTRVVEFGVDGGGTVGLRVPVAALTHYRLLQHECANQGYVFENEDYEADYSHFVSDVANGSTTSPVT